MPDTIHDMAMDAMAFIRAFGLAKIDLLGSHSGTLNLLERGVMSKVWFVTGASRGLGRAFTEAILETGDRVVATARNPEQLVELQGRYSGKIRTVALDVTDEAQAKASFEAAIASFGVLDVLVNNAGYGHVCPVEDTPLSDFRAQIETNLFGVIIMTKAVLPYFRERRAGHIIQVTSIAGRIGPAGRAPYAAAKFGVEGFSESLSKDRTARHHSHDH